MSYQDDQYSTTSETMNDSGTVVSMDSSINDDGIKPIRDAARQLSIILVRRGINCRLVTSSGISMSTVLRLSMSDKILSIYWRAIPEKLGCELVFLKKVVRGVVLDQKTCKRYMDKTKSLGLVFDDIGIQLETSDVETCDALHLCLETLMVETSNAEKDKIYSSMMTQLRRASYRASILQEQLFQESVRLKVKEGCLIFDKIFDKCYFANVRYAVDKWTDFVRYENDEKMRRDKTRWRLHASSNMDLDLQAWYHTVFYHEVYRLRGPFWYREAVLPGYRRSYDLVDNALTPLEEAALAHVLCSPDTTYGDVAGQMYVVEEIVSKEQFELFQTLAAKGFMVTKHPRTGRPAKKMFRFSFVEGNIYLTWKGKFGNQGVDLNDISTVTSGLNSEILKKSGRSEKAQNYLSVYSVGRSVDLYFDTPEERQRWHDLLEVLVKKEQGNLVDVEMLDVEPDATVFDKLVLYISLGRGIIGAYQYTSKLV